MTFLSSISSGPTLRKAQDRDKGVDLETSKEEGPAQERVERAEASTLGVSDSAVSAEMRGRWAG